MESGRRQLTQRLRRQLGRSGESEPLDAEWFRAQLAAHGYPGFGHLERRERRVELSRLLLWGLSAGDMDARVCQGLIYLARTCATRIRWDWLMAQAKLRNLQNRLGFLVDLAIHPGEPGGLARVRDELANARLLAESTFCWDSMPAAVRKWMQDNRPEKAAYWNVLSRFTTEEVFGAE
jgi:hypothetical protein